MVFFFLQTNKKPISQAPIFLVFAMCVSNKDQVIEKEHGRIFAKLHLASFLLQNDVIVREQEILEKLHASQNNWKK